MALNFTGYYEIIEHLSNAFESDPLVNRVSFGSLTEYDRTKETISPCVYIIPNPFSISENTVSVSFQIFCYDLISQIKLSEADILDMKDGYKNYQDCMDTTFSILTRVLSKYIGRTVQLNTTFTRVSSGPSFEDVYEGGSSGLCGWIGSITFEFDSNASKC